MVHLSQPNMTAGKTIVLTISTFVSKVMSLLFNMLSSFVIGFFFFFFYKEQASFNFMAAVTICSDFGAQEKKVCHCFHCFPPMCHGMMGLDAMIFFFECWVLSQLFHCPLSPSSRGSLPPLHFLSLGWYYLHIWGYWYFSWQSWFQLVLHPAKHFVWCTLHIS